VSLCVVWVSRQASRAHAAGELAARAAQAGQPRDITRWGAGHEPRRAGGAGRVPGPRARQQGTTSGQGRATPWPAALGRGHAASRGRAGGRRERAAAPGAMPGRRALAELKAARHGHAGAESRPRHGHAEPGQGTPGGAVGRSGRAGAGHAAPRGGREGDKAAPSGAPQPCAEASQGRAAHRAGQLRAGRREQAAASRPCRARHAQWNKPGPRKKRGAGEERETRLTAGRGPSGRARQQRFWDTRAMGRREKALGDVGGRKEMNRGRFGKLTGGPNGWRRLGNRPARTDQASEPHSRAGGWPA
jgi:hypothetical protein